jgi:hypothetical protein
MLFPSIGACNRNHFLRVMRHACCDANVFRVTEREAEDVVSRRDGDRAIIFAAFGMLAASTLTKAQQSPLTVSEVSPGAFRSHGRDGTHDARRATAKIGFVIGADAFTRIDWGGSVERESTARSDTRYLRATCSRANGGSTVPGFDAARHRLDWQDTTAKNRPPQKHLTSASA